jgi:hypothetical protein
MTAMVFSTSQDGPGGPEAMAMSSTSVSTSAITSVDVNPTAEVWRAGMTGLYPKLLQG